MGLKECELLYNDFASTGNENRVTELLNNLDMKRRKRWTNTVEKLIKWSSLKTLGADPETQNYKNPQIKPDKIASRLLNMIRLPSNKEEVKFIIQQIVADTKCSYDIIRHRLPLPSA